MIWAWFWGVLFLTAAVALVLVGRWCWREMGELGSEGDHAAPVKRAPVADATVPVLTTAGSPPWQPSVPAFLSAPLAENPAAADSVLVNTPPPPVTPPAIAAYASALEAAERERQAAEAAALAEAQAWQAELRAEAEATSPWVEREPLAAAMGFSDDTLMRIDTRKLMADVEEYGRQLAERGMAS